MSPFTFKQVCSADPAIFSDFSNFIEKDKIDLDESYDLAIKYIKSIEEIDLMPAFEAMDKAKWIDGCKKHLATGHKGQDFANK